MSQSINLADVQGMLRTKANAAGSTAAWGRRHGVSKQYAHQVLNTDRPPSSGMLASVGIKKTIVTVYQLVGETDAA